MSRPVKYGRECLEELMGLVEGGMSGAAALRQLGIPPGSMSSLRRRFGRDYGGTMYSAPNIKLPPAVEDSAPLTIGALATALSGLTEEILQIAREMAEASRCAHGLVRLDETLTHLASAQHEASGLRRRLQDVEQRLLARASVVHSSD